MEALNKESTLPITIQRHRLSTAPIILDFVYKDTQDTYTPTGTWKLHLGKRVFDGVIAGSQVTFDLPSADRLTLPESQPFEITRTLNDLTAVPFQGDLTLSVAESSVASLDVPIIRVEIDDSEQITGGVTVIIGPQGIQGIPGEVTAEYTALAAQIQSDRIAAGESATLAGQEAGVSTDQANYAIAAKNEIVPLAEQVSIDAQQVADDKATTQGYRDATEGYKNTAETARDAALNAAQWNPYGTYSAATGIGTMVVGGTTVQVNVTSTGVTPVDGVTVLPALTPGRGWDVTTPGTNSVTGTSETYAVGDMLKWNGVKMGRVPPSSRALSKVQQLEKNNLFQGDQLAAFLPDFLLDIQFSGNVVATSADDVHIYQVGRVYMDGTLKSIFSIGINATGTGQRICQWVYNGSYTEPAADAAGNRIDTLQLTELNNSGVTAVAVVNWSAISEGTGYTYNNATLRKQSLLAFRAHSKKYNEAVALNNALTTRVAADEKNSLFQGAAIDSYLRDFLIDIQFTGTVLATSADDVHIYQAGRSFVEGTLRNIFSIGINATGTGQRICQWLYNGSYTEPAVDAAGNRIDTLTLTELNGSGVTAVAVVNWSAISEGTGYTYNSSTLRKQSRLAFRTHTKKYTEATAIANRVAANEKNNLFQGAAIDSYLRDFLVSLSISGVVVNSTDVVHIHWVWRQIANPTLIANSLAIGINGTRVASWTSTPYTEPTADAKGNRYAVLSLTEIGGSGVTATAVVNWAFAPNGQTDYSSSANRVRSILSPRTYLSATAVKPALPTTTVPNRIYTVLNDIDLQNVIPSPLAPVRPDLVRQYSLSLYVDRFLIGFPFDTDVRFLESGTDKHRIISPRSGDNDVFTSHPTPSQTIAKSVVISGGSGYANRTLAFNQISTRESTGADALVAQLVMGDSTVEVLMSEVGVPDGFAHKAWGVTHEQSWKARIDYLLEQGYSASQIQAGSIDPSHDKHRIINVGAVSVSTSVDNYTLNYRGVTKTFALKAEGRGGWTYNAYLNKPRQVGKSQGSWDLLGLGNGTGTDYTGSQAQQYLFDRTAWTPNNVVDTTAMRSFFASTWGYTGSTRADYVAKMQEYEEDPTNPFYDKNKADTITDLNGNSWTVRFSMSTYQGRWRTMDNNGVRLASGSGSIGWKVGGSLASLDVTLPSHIIFQSCQNDGDVAHYGVMTKVFADAVKAEYAANSWGTVNIGISVIDGAGTYFPKLYPEVSVWGTMNESLRAVHNNNLARAIAANTSEDSNRVFVLSNTHIIPTARSLVYRGGNSPEYDLTGDEKDQYFVPSRTSVGIKQHINAVGHRPIGIHHYAWIRYTLGL